MDRTLIICKPDAVERGLSGEILARFERKGLRIVAAELRQIDRPTAERHYAEHEGKAFYEDLVTFITRSPSLLAVVEGPEDTYKVVRLLVGATENLVHASDSPESAEREIGLFFPAG
jgi:nucleoside-diphosphate kinase